jgi:hypothetical protein
MISMAKLLIGKENIVTTIVVTYEIRVFFEGAQKEVFSSILKKHYNYTKV